MTDLFSALKSSGAQTQVASGRCEVELAVGYRLIVAPWPTADRTENSEEFVLSVENRRFAAFMAHLFSDSRQAIAESLKGRKLCRDSAGTIAYAVVSITENDSQACLRSGKTLSLNDFLESVRATRSAWILRELLFHGSWTNFLAVTETIWAYLFLSFEAGIRVQQLELELANDASQVTSWRLKQPVDSLHIRTARESFDAVTDS